MVGVALSFGKNGLQDWLIQRITAFLLAAYLIFLVAYLVLNPNLSYADWRWLFSSLWMRTATTIVLASLIVHSWIGIWTVITDYIKPISLRLVTQVAFILGLLGCFVWGLNTLWRV